ncbi:MAG: lipoprotein-releasing ABC transporter permease subunit [Rhodobiaceae bacterium]|nr:lipoprotein-releasing ABC transporter permease subunit [Rhodobiaceae bacterium]
MMARRFITARKSEKFVSVITWISLIGITLGVATLIIVMAVMNGFRQELLNKILGINGHVLVYPADTTFTDYADVAIRLNKVDGVVHAVPLAEGQVMASGPTGAAGILLRGIRPEDIDAIHSVAETVRQGSLVSFMAGDGLLIGSRLAQNLGVIVGDKITLLQPRGAVTPFGVTPKVRAYEVTGIFEMGMAEYDSTFAIMPLAEAQGYLNLDDTVNAIEVYTDDPENVEAILPRIEAAAGRQIYVSDWRQRNATFFNTLQVERNVMFLILTLIILIAALNIISGLITLVRDKSADIAILRTMGLDRYAVLRIFFIAGASIGVVGTLSGLILGTLVCINIETIRQWISLLTGTELFSPEVYYLTQLPAEMNPHEVVAVVAMALFLSFVATLYPAWRAAQLDPVEALRGE